MPPQNVVIIGGGIIGVCAAFYLSRHELVKKGSVSVTLVEANEIASGASGKAGGFMARDPAWHTPETESLVRLSYSLHEELAHEFDGESSWGYRRLRALTLVKDLRKSQEALVEECSIRGVHPEPPSLGEEPTDLEWLQGYGIRSIELVAKEDGAAQVDPALFTKRIFQVALEAKVKYIKGRPTSWNNDSRLLQISTKEGEVAIPCDSLVIAAGPWSAIITEELLSMTIPISYLPGHSIHIRPSQPVPAHVVHGRLLGKGLTTTPCIFPWRDGLVYVGGENVGAPLPGGTYDVEIDPRAIQKLIQTSREVSRMLAEGVVERKQLCYRPTTPHGAPLVGLLKDGPGTTKAFVAAGHGPWGILLGPGTGKVMGELIIDGIVKSAEIAQLDPLKYIY